MSDQGLIEKALPSVPVAASVASAQAIYANLAPETICELQRTAEGIRATVGAAYLDAGRRLNRAKELLPHGRFTAWAEAELGMTGRTAENYMRAASFAEGKSETISVLPQATLYKLAAPRAPAEVVEQVVAEAAAGAVLDHKAIDRRLAEAKTREAELAKLKRRTPQASPEELKQRFERNWKAQTQRQVREARARAEKAAERERQQRDAEVRWQVVAHRLAEAAGDDAEALLVALRTWQRPVFMRSLEEALAQRRERGAMGGTEV